MLGKRSTDPVPATRFRSDRISSVNGQYFFSTREGTLEGPYFTRFDAEREIDAYIRRMRQSAEFPAAETFKKGKAGILGGTPRQMSPHVNALTSGVSSSIIHPVNTCHVVRIHASPRFLAVNP